MARRRREAARATAEPGAIEEGIGKDEVDDEEEEEKEVEAASASEGAVRIWKLD